MMPSLLALLALAAVAIAADASDEDVSAALARVPPLRILQTTPASANISPFVLEAREALTSEASRRTILRAQTPRAMQYRR